MMYASRGFKMYASRGLRCMQEGFKRVGIMSKIIVL